MPRGLGHAAVNRRPTVAQLRQMGYLPQSWSQTISTLNTGAYQISMQMMPPGCTGALCHVDGLV
jgi:hypothetical protein